MKSLNLSAFGLMAIGLFSISTASATEPDKTSGKHDKLRCIADGVVTGSHLPRCVRPGGTVDSDVTVSTTRENLAKVPGVTIRPSR